MRYASLRSTPGTPLKKCIRWVSDRMSGLLKLGIRGNGKQGPTVFIIKLTEVIPFTQEPNPSCEGFKFYDRFAILFAPFIRAYLM